jgi:hypothetical protein
MCLSPMIKQAHQLLLLQELKLLSCSASKVFRFSACGVMAESWTKQLKTAGLGNDDVNKLVELGYSSEKIFLDACPSEKDREEFLEHLVGTNGALSKNASWKFLAVTGVLRSVWNALHAARDKAAAAVDGEGSQLAPDVKPSATELAVQKTSDGANALHAARDKAAAAVDGKGSQLAPDVRPSATELAVQKTSDGALVSLPGLGALQKKLDSGEREKGSRLKKGCLLVL